MIDQLPSAMRSVQAANPALQKVVIENQGSYEVPGEFNMMPIPPAMTQNIASATGGSAVAKTCYFGNEAFFNPTPTNNGSGADSITNAYGDGWSGKGYNQLFASASMGRGVKCYGFTLQVLTTSSGAQNGTALNAANPSLLVYNLVNGNSIPLSFVLSQGARNTQYLAGEMTVKAIFWINSVSQFSYVVSVGTTSSLTIMTTPIE